MIPVGQPYQPAGHFDVRATLTTLILGSAVAVVAAGLIWLWEISPIRPGTCSHLPKTLVHSLANTGESEMRVLGVFRPAGSPAEAYYPDGTQAGM